MALALPKLYGSIGASVALTLYALHAICIQKAWRHFFPVRDIHFLFKRARNLSAFYRSLVRPLYFAECDIDPDQAAGEPAHHPRGARPRTDSHIAAPLIFKLQRYPNQRPQKFPNSAIRDATSGQGAPAYSWIRRLRVVLPVGSRAHTGCADGKLVDVASF